MDDLNRLTASELVRLHNAQCAGEYRIEGPWKKSKHDLIKRIEALGEPDPARQQTCTTEKATVDDTKPGAAGKQTVRAHAEAFLTATDGLPLTYDEIAARIREALPGSGPTPQSIRWYATKMRMRGETVRVRHLSRKGQ